MAVISTARGLAPRNGLYATFSITTPSTMQTMTEAITAANGCPKPDIVTSTA